MHTSLACGEWSTIGCLNHHTQLFIGDVVKVTFYDMQGELISLSFDFKITSFEQGEPHAWPRLIAEHINKIFALQSSGICKAHIDFHCIAKCDDRDVSTQRLYEYVYPEHSERYNAGTKVLQPKDGCIYQCRPWPFNEFCRKAKDKQSIFEPGIGKSWAMAWLQL